MAVDAQTVQTYDNTVIREDLAEAYSLIDPEELPFQEAIGTADAASNTYHEWSILNLQEVDPDNAVIEGDDDPDTDEGDLAERVGNYTQISDKKAKVSNTSNAVNAAANNVQRLNSQVMLKMRALKRDIEVILLSNRAANPGSDGVARRVAGLPAWLRSNVEAGAGGTNPTLSGGDSGYPNAAAGAGTVRALTEDIFADAIQSAWDAGGNPTLALVNSGNKRLVSRTFTGNSTRYKDAIDRKLVAAIDVYDSDFGQKTVAPTHFLPTLNPGGANDSYYVPLIDPEYLGVSWLETVRQKDLAVTGHSRSKLIWGEYTLECNNEKAHAIIRDLTNG